MAINNLNVYRNFDYSTFCLKPYQKGRYTMYCARFGSSAQLQSFLNANPPVNENIFAKQSSMERDKWSGMSLKKSIDSLLINSSKEYTLFSSIEKGLQGKYFIPGETTTRQKCVVGSQYHIPNVIAGSPKCMIKRTKIEEKKFITIHFNIAYSSSEPQEAIENRGHIVLQLIRLLEHNHYRVKFNVFEFCTCYDEAIHISVQLKRPQDYISIGTCFFPLVRKEFLRRICFRVLESMPVTSPSWGGSYGNIVSPQKTRECLDIPQQDILFSAPHQMGITGDDLEDDFNRCIENLNLKKYIKIR